MARHRCEAQGCSHFTGQDQQYCSVHMHQMGETPPLLEQVMEANRPVAGVNPDAASRRMTADPVTIPTQDPEIYAAKIARILAAQESAARFDHTRRGRQRLKDLGRDGDPVRAPVKVIPRRNRPDPTTPIDPVTMKFPESIPPGHVMRWVRTTDWAGRPSEARVAEFEDYGYEVAIDAKGEPIEGRLGVLMHAPPEQYAYRANDKSPVGALNRDDALALADELAETANRVAGTEVAAVTVEREHGGRQVQVEAGLDQFNDE